MRVREAMSESVLTIGPEVTLRAAAQKMAARKVGSAVVMDPEMPGPGIISERDVLIAVADGADPETALVKDFMTGKLVFAEPGWSLEEASMAMAERGVRHLIAMENGDVAGIVSMRDIVKSLLGTPERSLR